MIALNLDDTMINGAAAAAHLFEPFGERFEFVGGKIYSGNCCYHFTAATMGLALQAYDAVIAYRCGFVRTCGFTRARVDRACAGRADAAFFGAVN